MRRKILIVKPSSLGDIIQALPVLRLLKLHDPGSEIHWWVDSTLSGLLEDDPDLSGLFLFERRRWASPLHWNEAAAAVRRLRAMRFDWVIDLQSLARSGLFAWLADGRLTVGLDDPREGARGFYDIAVMRPARDAHAVDWYLEVLRRLNVPLHWDFTWLPRRPGAADAVRTKWGADSGRWLVLQPGARWPNKRWPAESFADLVGRLAADDAGLRFVILGSREDAAAGERIARAEPARCLDLTGRTTLPEMLEWIRRGELMVTNDTGPMHAAAALGRPVVALFGPTDPRRTGPYGQVDRVLKLDSLPCIPCLKPTCAYEKPMECLRAVTPAAVQAEVRRHLWASGGDVTAARG